MSSRRVDDDVDDEQATTDGDAREPCTHALVAYIPCTLRGKGQWTNWQKRCKVQKHYSSNHVHLYPIDKIIEETLSQLGFGKLLAKPQKKPG